MAEQSGFFNAVKTLEGYDRTYDASDFANYFSRFISNGVFATPTNQLKVVAKTGLSVVVRKGSAYIDGYWYELTEDKEIILNPNTTSYVITDSICCILNKTNRQITIEKKEDVKTDKPINDGTIHELVLATINVSVGTGTIKNSDITDKRPDKEYCGFVEGLIKQIDETELFLQYDSMFNEWFNEVKGTLGEDVAGNLLNQINQIKQSMQVIRSGTAEPDNSVGKDGDIYIRIVE